MTPQRRWLSGAARYQGNYGPYIALKLSKNEERRLESSQDRAPRIRLRFTAYLIAALLEAYITAAFSTAIITSGIYCSFYGSTGEGWGKEGGCC